MATKKYTVEIDVESKTLGQLENELSQINEELKQVDRNSEAFKNLSKQAQALNKEIEKTNNEIEGLKLEDKLMAADGAAKIFGGSLASVVGTLGVLGVESEAFGEFEKKAASAIAVGMGIKDVSEGFSQFSLVMKKSGIAAKLFGSTTSKALIATGVGAFVVLLGSVIAYWDDITKAVKNFANAVPFVGKAIETVKGLFNDLFDAARPVLEFLGILPDEAERAQMAIVETTNEAISQLERELAIAQAAGESARKIFELRQELIQQELANLRAANAEKEEIFKKETELLALQAAEQKRIREEASEVVVREKVKALDTIKAVGIKEIEVVQLTGKAVKIVNRQQTEAQAAYVQAVIDNQAKLDAARQVGLDNLIAVVGAESKVGRAALIAKQVLAAKELIMEAKKTITFATLKASEATVATATGAARTAAVGFPANIPLLIAYAAQAAGIIAAVVSAVRGAKKAGKGVGGEVPTPSMGNISGGRGAAPAMPSPTQPERAPVQEICPSPTVRAYVLSGDARSAQEADAKLNSRRSLG